MESNPINMKTKVNLALLLLLFVGLCQAQTEYDKPFISIGVIVSDLEKSMDFYTNVLGMQEAGGFSVNEEFGQKTGLTGGIPFDVKVLKLYDDPNATEYKLMSFGNESKGPDNHIQAQNGIQYITLFLKSTDGVLQRLKENNITPLGETPIELPDGKTFILVQDPDGIFIELIGN